MRADHPREITASLATVLGDWGRRTPDRAPVVDAVRAIAETAVRISTVVAISPLKSAVTSSPDEGAAASHGEGDSAGTNRNRDEEAKANRGAGEQNPLGFYAERLLVEGLAGSDVAAVCSEETDAPIPVTPGAPLVVALDPVDGSANIDANAPIGTIFSILPVPAPGADPASALLQPGRRQVAAGMIVYGPATMLALTVGQGTDLYVLDPRTRDFRTVRRGVRLPTDSREYAINAANARHWGPGIYEYVQDLVNGALGPRERDFDMHWMASLVAEAYRILTRGGIFLCPADARPGHHEGRIRLVYEANPIALLCEQAGGDATDGVTPILDVTPREAHQRVPLVFGSRSKVERVRRYLLQPQTNRERFPLFASRGLLRT